MWGGVGEGKGKGGFDGAEGVVSVMMRHQVLGMCLYLVYNGEIHLNTQHTIVTMETVVVALRFH